MLSPLPLPLETIIYDVRRATAAKLYYPALLVTLTLPEICVGLTLPKSLFVKQKHYIEWVDRYCPMPDEREIGQKPYLGVTGADCYRLRGGLVHRADLRGHAFFDGTHVIFTTPDTSGSIHALSLEVGEKRAWMLDLVSFCDGMIDGVRRWYKDNESNQVVAESMKSLIRTCPNGVPPFVGGGSVVASGE